jgi:EAL domain-containing protein (putative c-di-GMP-specific phosphodiesterase class I)/GGDEF domain-containing protein
MPERLVAPPHGPTDIVALKAAIDDALRNRRSHDHGLALFVLDVADHDLAVRDDRVLHPLQTCLRGDDLLTRIGERRFALLCPGVRSATQAWIIGRRLLGAVGLTEVRASAEHDVAVGAVVGADAHATAASLLRAACAALDLARTPAPVRMVIHTAGSPSASQPVRARADQLRAAITDDDIELHYQPIVDIGTGRVAAVEALLRWTHPDDGPVPPGEVVALAEQTGTILTLGEWILRTACRQLAAWQSQRPDAPGVVCVNISAHQLEDPDFPATVRSALAEAGLPPEALCLELTETVLLPRSPSAQALLTALHHIGVRIAIDDFGTGYSCLTYLKDLPADVIKIAREFVQEITTDHRDVAIVRAVCDIARALDIDVVVEGVESPEQLAALAQLGPHLVQGYLLRRPCRADVALEPIAVPATDLAV